MFETRPGFIRKTALALTPSQEKIMQKQTKGKNSKTLRSDLANNTFKRKSYSTCLKKKTS